MKLYSTCRISLALTAISLVGLATSLPAAAAKMYSITDLGTLGGNYSRATGINDLGQVVGVSGGHAFRTAPNSPIDPATDDLGSLSNSDIYGCQASGINNLGQVVGNCFAPSYSPGVTLSYAFLTAPNSPINPATDNLGSFGGRPVTTGVSVNDLGQVAGRSVLGDGFPKAFRTDPNSPIDPTTDNIGSLNGGVFYYGGVTYANGINNLGQVVGAATTVDNQRHAFRTAPNSPINPATDDLGTLREGPDSSGEGSVANAINDKGQVVGNSQTVSGETHAFRTAPNSPINPATDDLGTLGGGYSTPNAINNKGQVVGEADTDSGQRHAFVYYKHHMLDLNNLIPADSNFILTSANGINKKGQIVGAGSINGETHAFLLTPER